MSEFDDVSERLRQLEERIHSLVVHVLSLTNDVSRVTDMLDQHIACDRKRHHPFVAGKEKN